MTNHYYQYFSLIQRAAISIAFASLFSALCIAEQPPNEIPLVDNGSLRAFALALDNRAESQDFVSIVSDKILNQTTNNDERQRIEENRKLGQSILSTVDAASTAPMVSLSDVSDMLKTRRYLLQKRGYGNLVVSYAIEEAACRVLFRLMSSPDCDTVKVLPFIRALTEESPSSAYWFEVLHMEGERFTAETKYPDQKDDCFRLAEIIHTLNDTSQKQNAQDGNWQVGGSNYAGCYEKYMPEQVGWLLVQTSVFKSSVEALYEVRKNVNIIPENRKEIVKLLDKYAAASMRDKARLGGAIDGESVWLAWRELVEMTVRK